MEAASYEIRVNCGNTLGIHAWDGHSGVEHFCR